MTMKQERDAVLTRPRIAFLLTLAIGVTVLFYWVIKGFILAVLLAAILAAIAHPFNSRLTKSLRGRRSLASGITIALSLVLVIMPLVLFIGVLVGEAINISESAGAWVGEQVAQKETLRKQLEADPDLQRLLPYQDTILEKAGQLATRAGSFVARGFAAGAKGTAEFLLMLFVMLYAMFYFLVEGEAILNAALRFTPLSVEDKTRLLGTFSSVGRATLKGTLVIGIVQGGLAGLSFWVAGIQGAVFWGAVMAVLSIIPGVGTALIWVPAVIFLVLEQRIAAAVGVGLWCALVVGTIDNILRPLLVGKDTEMPDLLVMLTTLGGLALFGPAGIIVGPIIGALYVTIWKLWGGAVDEAKRGSSSTGINSQGEYVHDTE
jgi:predicted PurR-regulated permease PerM